MNYRDKSNDELIKELQKLQQEYDSLKTSYEKDISEYKLIEKTLQKSEEKYRLLFENSGDAILLTNQDGSIYSANPEACRIYGRSEQEICELGRNGTTDLNDPRLEPALSERKKTGKFKGELNQIRKDGTIFPAEVTSILFRDSSGNEKTSMIVRDISERKQAEKAMHEREELFKIVLSNAPISIFVTDDKGIIILHEGKILEKIGMKPGENVGVSAFDLFNELRVVERNGKVTNGKSVLNRVFKGKVISGITELNGMHFDNQFVPFFDTNDKVIGFIGVATDITASKKIEEELWKSKGMLEKLNQHLNEIREEERALISREIHDELGQSLTALKLDLYHMYKYVKVDKEAQIRLSNMVELVSDTIKNVQRISSDLRPEILDDLGLAAAIEWYSEEFENRTGIKCRVRIDDSIFGDSQKNLVFFRILQEALTNVIRHANASSVSIMLNQSKQGITMTIKDNGIGIPEEKIESYKSLGLISMRERVRQFDGKFVVSSKEGKGTKLTFFIPK